ncbi:DUF6879 family protein [Kitasatospora brasiliensis]|uniref:DUF6879 family protein n=1 Tax=Kitasatospora brasiliensis TaxID=3058040 RepID=UPI00292E22D8|nr:DUF6879 family protein [Kitasatospora sp. K002]
MHLSRDAFGALFDGFHHAAFRLATRDTYGSVDAYQRFLAGEPKPPDHNAAWRTRVQRHTDAGRRIHRVHILTRPLSPYLRFELDWGYRTNATAGEEFSILDTTDQPNPLQHAPDFWLFDESTAVSMAYDTNGYFLAAQQEPDTHRWIHHRDTALAHATPFPTWWARHGTT